MEQDRPILRLARQVPLVLKETRDVRRAAPLQRPYQGLNGTCWYDGVVEAVDQEDGPVDLVDKIGGRAALVEREAHGKRPDEAVQLVVLKLVGPSLELE